MTDVVPANAGQELLRLRVRGQRSPIAGRMLTVARGDIVAIIGNSGCGKTTLLRGLAAALAELGDKQRPQESWRWHIADGACVTDRLPLAVTPQDGESILAHLSSEDNVRYYQRIVGRTPDAGPPLGRLGLAAKAATIAGALSGGERRRLGLAIDLAIEPTVLAADEPLTALDSPTADLVFHTVLKPYGRENAVVFSVHSPLDQWLADCTQVWVMAPDDGGPGEVVYAGSGLEFVAAARALNGNDGTPAAHVVLTHLDAFLKAVATSQEAQPPASTVRPRPGARPALSVSTYGLFTHVLRYEFQTQLLPRLKTPTYWVAQGASIGIVFLANFLLAADRLPFSIPLASISVLVTALFVATVMTSRLWVDAEGANIRQQFLRGVSAPVTVVAKVIPTLVEVAFLALLVLAGRWLLSDQGPIHLRASFPGLSTAHLAWPDNYATLLTSSWLPAVVPMIAYVGLVGALQGLCVSLLVALGQQEQSTVRRIRSPRPNGGNGLVRASSTAVTLVVIQITVSGAFGQVAADRFASSIESLPGSFTDLLGSLSPLRWGYNWTLVAEYRRARCDWAGTTCTEHDDSIKPAYLDNHCLTLGRRGAGQSIATDPRIAENWHDCSAETVGHYVEARTEVLRDLNRRQTLFEFAGLPVPLESMADGYSASRFRDYERARRGPAKSKGASDCVLQRALLNYENSLSGILVSRAMFRPRWADTEFCLRRCPTADWQQGDSFSECDNGVEDRRLDPPIRYPIVQRVLEEGGLLPPVTSFPCSYLPATTSGGRWGASARELVEDAHMSSEKLTAGVRAQVGELCVGEPDTADRLLALTMFATAAIWALMDALLLRKWYRGLQRV